jgi:hypothetical protein
VIPKGTAPATKKAASQLQSALKACGANPSTGTPGSTGKSAPKTPIAGLKDELAKFKACMHEHGASFPIQRGEVLTSPQYSAALKACYKGLRSSAVSPAG